MADHFVKVVEDGTLAATGGWLFTHEEDNNEIGFVAEQSVVADETRLSEAWVAAKKLVLEQAVRDGIVEWADPVRRDDDPSGAGAGSRPSPAAPTARGRRPSSARQGRGSGSRSRSRG